MNYQRIYNELIQKRRIQQINKTKTNNVQYHHIIPISCGGTNDKRQAKYNNSNYNIVGLTIREHYFAHLLLLQIYKKQYGINSAYWFKMFQAIKLMLSFAKYKTHSSKLYELLKLKAIQNGAFKTTSGRTWVTNGKRDIFLKINQEIPVGFWKGRTIAFTEEQKQLYSNKIKDGCKGRIAWNKGKRGIYSKEYRKKLSDNHADCSGEKNGRHGSKMLFNIQLQQKQLVGGKDMQTYLNAGWVSFKDVQIYNNGIIEKFDIIKPAGFIRGKLRLLSDIKGKHAWVVHPYLNIMEFVKKQQIQQYLANGYIIGHRKNN